MDWLRETWDKRSSTLALALTRIVFGYVFIDSGWEKVTNPLFASHLDQVLGRFASENPTLWYKDFLLNLAIPNAQTLGVLIGWGELLVGISLFLGLFATLGALGGLLLNLNFFFAAGWMSPSTHTVNLIMAAVQILFIVAAAGKYLSLDYFLARRFPRLYPWTYRRVQELPI